MGKDRFGLPSWDGNNQTRQLKPENGGFQNDHVTICMGTSQRSTLQSDRFPRVENLLKRAFFQNLRDKNANYTTLC